KATYSHCRPPGTKVGVRSDGPDVTCCSWPVDRRRKMVRCPSESRRWKMKSPDAEYEPFSDAPSCVSRTSLSFPRNHRSLVTREVKKTMPSRVCVTTPFRSSMPYVARLLVDDAFQSREAISSCPAAP